MLDIERQYRGMTRRAGIFEVLEERFRTNQFADEQTAVAIRKDQELRRLAARGKNGESHPPQRLLFELANETEPAETTD